MRILIIGKNGQLGKSISKALYSIRQNNKYIFVGKEELDLSNNNNIDLFFKNKKFDAIINCAAYTNVDKAEKEVVLSNQVNNLAVAQISKIAKQQNSKLIHISTDYVFDGNSNASYVENDLVNPINLYGKTKLAGEQAILQEMVNNAIIIRTSWLYSEFGNNFVNKILSLSQTRNELDLIYDQVGSPTYATDLANVILKIMNNDNFLNKEYISQLFHYSNKDSCSWNEFAKEIVDLNNINCKINSISTKEYPMAAMRPRNSVLNSDKISDIFKVDNFNWKYSLRTMFISLDANNNNRE
jgi:dTDP-4-dehydrorhamnose reductase